MRLTRMLPTIVLAALFSTVTGAAGQGTYTVSWLGNSFPGGHKWVQQDIEDIHVTEDGTVYAVIDWDEAGAEVTAYKDGDVVAVAGHTHGWGYHGGSAIAVNSKYVYFGQQVENEGGHLVDPNTWPPQGFEWYGVARRYRSDLTKAAPFPGGKGGKGDTLPGGFLVIHELPDGTRGPISGLWATDTRLYVSCPHDNTIRVYDAESMAPVTSWPLERPGRMCLDCWGRLRIIQRASPTQPARLLCFSADGKRLPHELPFPSGVVPYDLCTDFTPYPATGRAIPAPDSDSRGPYDMFYVSDVGPTQAIYSWLDGSAQLSLILGPPHGIYSQPAGRFGDRRFNHPVGVGVDGQGNIYVANSASSAREAGGGGGSTVLESYTRKGKLNWRLLGLEFIDCADLDPVEIRLFLPVFTHEERQLWRSLGLESVMCIDSSPAGRLPRHAYTKEEHFLVDLARTDGSACTYEGYTVDKFRYPQDPRLHIWSAGAWLRCFARGRFLFVNDMNAEHLQVYRFDLCDGAETATPVGLFAKSHIKIEGWPPQQPAEGEWIWRDRNGNGAFDPDEYETAGGKNAPSSQGWWVDRLGSVWLATETAGIRQFPCGGLDEKRNPIWTYSTVVTFDKPPELERVKRLRYIAATDTMYLGGTAGADKNQHWKPMGPVICRYDDWSGLGRTLRWKVVAPCEKGSAGHESCEPMGFDVAGDYVFVPYTGRSKELGFAMGHIEIFRAETGARVSSMEPSKEIGEIGLQDIRECLTAHQLPGGEYLVFLEDDWKAKVLMYRWKPE